MKIIHYTDTHWYPFHQFSSPTRNALTTRHMETIECHEWIAKMIRKLKPDLVVNGGDLVHQQGSVDTDTLHALTIGEGAIEEACADLKIKRRILVGNHDKKSDEAKLSHSTHFLKYWPTVELLDSCEVRDGIAFIPHSHFSDADFAKALNSVQGQRLAFSHLDFKGAKFHEALSASHGLEPNVFKNFTRVVNGHYHLAQELGNIFMTGTPQYFSFREPRNDIPKGILYIDTETNRYERIPNPVSPGWLMFDEPEVAQIKDLSKNNYLMINVTSKGILEDHGLTDEFLREFKGHEIITDVERIKPNLITDGEAVDVNMKSEEENLSEYIDLHQDMPDEERDTLKQLGAELISKAR